MARPAVLLLLTLGAAAALSLRSDSDDKDWSAKDELAPVAKVVKMLKDMAAQLDFETKNDQEMYDKLVCWCETNDKEKTKAIETAKQQISDLTAAIEEYTSKGLSLEAEIGSLKGEIAKGKKALEEASAVRAKELADFNRDEKDMIASIGSLKGAVVTLGKQNPGSALVQRETLMQVTKILQKKMKTQPNLVTGSVAPHHRRLLLQLLSKPDGMIRETLLQQPTGATSYNSQSGEIFGMLKQMKETFETNLVESKGQEATGAKAFAELKASKSGELKAAGDKLFEKETDFGDTKEKNARAKEDLSNTEDALEKDTYFLADLKKKCATMDADWAARSKMRAEEVVAVGQTIAILTDDEANDTLTKGGVFMQLRSEAMKEEATRAQVLKFLADAGQRLKSPRVAYLATKMRFDPFGKMRDSIDNMVGALGKEKNDEIHHKDECVEDFSENDKETGEKHEIRTDLSTEIDSLNADEAQLTDEEKRMIQEIADAQLQMKQASANREQENKDFQETVADQDATQAILNKAVAKLGEFYNRKAALLQTKAKTKVPGEASSPMPEGLGEYKKGGGGGAMAMIQQIISESKATKQDAIVSELDAQSAYEAFVQDTNKAIKAKQTSIAANQEDLAEDKVEEAHDEADKRSTEGEILKLGDMVQALHGACDFTLDNFDARQTSRDEETEALKQAKSIFSGAGFGR